MSKRPMGHGDLRNMRDFKAVAADHAYYLTLSDKPVSVCLTERQMYILSVWNTYTPWMTRWYNTEDTSAAELATIAAEIEALLMCGCGVPAPTLTDRFNGNTYITNTATTYGDTQNTWNTGGQTVVSIAPSLDYATGSPVDIDLLTCHALAMLVNALVNTAEGIAEGTLEEGKDIIQSLSHSFAGLAVAGGAASAVFGTGAAILGFAAGPWIVLGLAVAAVGTTLINLPGTDITMFDDNDAIDEVICVMQQNTSGADMTRAAFQNALTPNTLTGNAAALAAVIQPFLSDLDTYLQFMVAANDLYDVADIGALPECACVERQMHTWDFAAGPDDWQDDSFGSTWNPLGYWGMNMYSNWSIFTPTVPFDVYEIEVHFLVEDTLIFYPTSATNYADQSRGVFGGGNPRVWTGTGADIFNSGDRLGLTGDEFVGSTNGITKVVVYGPPI